MLHPPETGLFLVRESTNFPGDYTLCVSCEGKVEHYRIIYHNGKLTIDEEAFFENLMQLVEVWHYCYYISLQRFVVCVCVYSASLCVVVGFVFHIFVQPCRVPGTNNDQEVSKRKCEENVECHCGPVKGKEFYTVCVQFDFTALCWSVQTTLFCFRSV